jgi:predicted metal-dependent peptidase
MAKSDVKDKIVVLADVSGSMSDADGGSRERKTRFQLLTEALAGLPKDVCIIAFDNNVYELRSVAELRLTGGGTSLHFAIDAAAKHEPVRTIIISDGEPDNEELALKAVEKLTGVIDVIFCGSPGNERAKKFLESLARAGMGGFYKTGDQVDVKKQLPAVIAGLLSK